jgi:hypothetical protein
MQKNAWLTVRDAILTGWWTHSLSGGRLFTEKEPHSSKTRAGRHDRVNMVHLRKRRAKNKLARKSRRINRITAKH